jgi:hypothetical protein
MRSKGLCFYSIVLAAALLVTSQSLLAETNNNNNSDTNTSKVRHTSRRPASDSTSTESVYGPQNPKWELYAGPGMMAFGGVAGFAINFGGAYKVMPNMPLYVGADLGVGFASGTEIQILPTAYWVFEVPSMPKFHFMGGLSLGPTIVSEGATIPTVNINGTIIQGTSVSASSVQFELLFRPGMQYEVGKNFMATFEPKFGILSSSFIFNPTLNGVYYF